MNDPSTVVLLGNDTNQLSGYIGFKINARPEVGLLTSTARTFIQNGVTTKYATHVVGTTLDKGRLYAQFLERSSRILFNTLHHQNYPTMELPSLASSLANLSSGKKSTLESQNDVLNTEEPAWQNMEEALLLSDGSAVVGNSDFIALSDRRNLQRMSSKKNKTSFQTATVNNINNNDIESNAPSLGMSRVGQLQESVLEGANKVSPINNLQTYTVRNIFSRREFLNEESLMPRQLFQNTRADGNVNPLRSTNRVILNRSPKLYHQLLMDTKNSLAGSIEGISGDDLEHEFFKEQLSTTTYYGFSDFTTIVGESLIIFSPSTQILALGGAIRDCIIERNIINTNPSIGEMKTYALVSEAVRHQSETWTHSNVIDCALAKTHTISLYPRMNDCDETSLNILYKDTPSAQPILHLTANRDDYSSTIIAGGIHSQATYSRPPYHEVLKIYATLSCAEAISKSLMTVHPNIYICPNRQHSICKEVPNENKTNIFSKPLSSIEIKSKSDIVRVNSSLHSSVSTANAEEIVKANMLQVEEEDTTQSQSKFTEIRNNSDEPIITFPEVTKCDDDSTTKINSDNDISISESKLIFTTNISKVVPNGYNTVYREYLRILQRSPSQLATSTTHSLPDEENDKKETQILPSFDILETPIIYSLRSSSFESLLSKNNISKPIDMSNPEKKSEHIFTKEKKNNDNEVLFEYKEFSKQSKDNSIGSNTKSSRIVYLTAGNTGIELLYKTLFTTYRYLTTFFNDESHTSISTRREIYSNVVTSTLQSNAEDINPTTVTAEMQTIKNRNLKKDLKNCISETKLKDKKTTNKSKYILTEVLKGILLENEYLNGVTANNQIYGKSSVVITSLYDKRTVQTYFTTYTYYTTIFVDDVTKIMSRTEVQENYYADIIKPTKKLDENKTKTLGFEHISPEMKDSGATSNEFGKEINSLSNNTMAIISNNKLQDIANDQRFLRRITTIQTANNYSRPDFINKYGERHVTNQKYNLLEDQISSESNTDEITSSSTLLLRTSFTTFTYYTTMYSNDMTNVACSMETITNIAPETLYSSKIENSDATLPITFYTTFTYWTKLAKNGEIRTLSREETISSIVKPSLMPITGEVDTIPQKSTADMHSEPFPNIRGDSVGPSGAKVSERVTFYTTYTYYTTSYDFDNTIIHSRYEILTTVSTPTITPSISSKLDRVICNNTNIENRNKDPASTNPDSLTIGSIRCITPNLPYDFKKLLDGDHVGTLYFMTAMLPTIAANGSTLQISSSVYGLHVDEENNILLSSSSEITSNGNGGLISSKFKTELATLTDNAHFGNYLSVLHQPQVIFTFTENPDVEIRDRTSSLVIERPQIKANKPTISDRISSEPVIILKTAEVLIKGTSSENSAIDLPTKRDNTKSYLEEAKDFYNSKLRLPLHSIKQNFTPLIRPFASRNRPLFSPKKKSITPDNSTVGTRIDLTPPITAPLSMKTVGRLSSSRKLGFHAISLPREVYVGSVTLPSRRSFARSIKPPSPVGNGVLSNLLTIALVSIGGTGRSRQSSIRSSHRVGALVRPSSASSFRKGVVTIHPGNPRTRIKSTSLFISSQQIQAAQLKVEQGFRRSINDPGGFTAANLQPNKSNDNFHWQTLSTETSTITPLILANILVKAQIVNSSSKIRPQANYFASRVLQPTQTYPKNGVQKEKKNYENNGNISYNENDSEYEDEGEYDNDAEAEDKVRRRRSNLKRSSKKSVRLSRIRRNAVRSFQARSNFRNRFRNLKQTATKENRHSKDLESEMLSLTPTSGSRMSGSFIARHSVHHHTQAVVASTASTKTNNYRAVRPTGPKGERAQFTLRNKNSTTAQKSYVRHTTNSNARAQNTAPSQRLSAPNSKNRRIKSYTSNSLLLEPPSRISSRSRNNLSRMRTTVRGRNRNEYNAEQAIPLNDGTLTVTHVIPAEVSIPVVNGKVTEYKNILTARTSTELLGSHQYTRFSGSNGQTVLALIREDSSVNFDGATEITQYVLHESPTTKVIFTPTTIRGRKTSFSHIIPSTVYSVENLVSTSKPHISGNAPFANILLSQLLFGNIGLHAGNPFLGALGDTLVSNQKSILGSQVPQTPVTEYRTHKSTFVTTLFEGTSTVIPVTFQGKKILTTVYETSAQTITATEIVTDTIITTQAQQIIPQFNSLNFNSLLLQQLFLQQEVQSQFEQIQQATLRSTSLQPDFTNPLQQLSTNKIRLNNEHNKDTPKAEENQASKPGRKKTRKSGKNQKQMHQATQDETPEELSTITLYVSGKRPGEFSTILSTLTLDHSHKIHKRQVSSNVKATPCIGGINDYYVTDGSEFIIKTKLFNLITSKIVSYNTKTITQIDTHIMEKGRRNSLYQVATLETKMVGTQKAFQETPFQSLHVPIISKK